MLEGKSLSSIHKILPNVLLEAGIGSPKSNYNFGGFNGSNDFFSDFESSHIKGRNIYRDGLLTDE